MFRNNGINYKFPRSAGGRFYSQRIDEGRSRLRTEYTFLPVEVITVYTDDLWTWNKRDVNEFNSGSAIYIGNVTGTVAAVSYYSGTTSRRTVPSITYTFSSNFQTPGSGGLALIPIEPGMAFPRRFEMYISFMMKEVGGGGQQFGFYFGANNLTGSATGSFYSSAVMFNLSSEVKSSNITSGTIGAWSLEKGSGVAPTNAMASLRFLVENKSLTGTAEGPVWRIHLVGDPDARTQAAVGLYTGYTNNSSGSNSTWTLAGNLDRIGLIFGRNSSGSVALNSGDFVSLQEIIIKKHPLGD